MCLFGYPDRLIDDSLQPSGDLRSPKKVERFSILRFFQSSPTPSGREARVVVPSTSNIPDLPSTNTIPDPTPTVNSVGSPLGEHRVAVQVVNIRTPPLLPPPIPPLRLEDIRQMILSCNMEREMSIPIHYVQNNRFDGFVDIDEAESLRDSMSRYSVASDRIISIENDRVDGVLEIDPESRNSIETQ